MPSRSTSSGLVPLQATALAVPILLLGLLAAQHAAIGGFGPPALFGDRSVAAFDLWSIQHFCSGILLGALIMRATATRPVAWPPFVFAVLGTALIWEAAELMMEAGWFGIAVADWKGSFEHWGNRFLGDPAMVVAGGVLARRFAHAWKIVLVPAGFWLLINVSAPNSMYIQNLLF